MKYIIKTGCQPKLFLSDNVWNPNILFTYICLPFRAKYLVEIMLLRQNISKYEVIKPRKSRYIRRSIVYKNESNFVIPPCISPSTSQPLNHNFWFGFGFQVHIPAVCTSTQKQITLYAARITSLRTKSRITSGNPLDGDKLVVVVVHDPLVTH